MRRPWMPAVWAAASLAGCQCGPPSMSAPLVLAYEAGPMRIEGHGFGTAGANAAVIAAGTEISSESAGALWSDEAIEVTLPPGVISGNVVVRTPAGEATARLEVYRLEEWD